jgi:hypothetical protein
MTLISIGLLSLYWIAEQASEIRWRIFDSCVSIITDANAVRQMLSGKVLFEFSLLSKQLRYEALFVLYLLAMAIPDVVLALTGAKVL